MGYESTVRPELGNTARLCYRRNYPGGRYTLLYEGKGTFELEWDASIVSQEPGRALVDVTPNQGIRLVITETDPQDPIRNFRFIMPGFESTYETQPFHPSYLEFLGNFSVLRFMVGQN